MDAAEYKHVVLGLIFLKYISDAFEEKNQFLTRESVLGADLKILTNTGPKMFSGYQKKPGGSIPALVMQLWGYYLIKR